MTFLNSSTTSSTYVHFNLFQKTLAQHQFSERRKDTPLKTITKLAFYYFRKFAEKYLMVLNHHFQSNNVLNVQGFETKINAKLPFK